MDSGAYKFTNPFKDMTTEKVIDMYCTNTKEGTVFSRKIASTFEDGKGDHYAIVINYDYILKQGEPWVICAMAQPQPGSDLDLDGLRESAKWCIKNYEDKAMKFWEPIIIIN